MNSIFYKLAESVLVYVNAASLSVMNIAFNNCRIGTGFHFKSGNSIIMDVIFLEITLRKKIKINSRFIALNYREY